MSSRKPSEPFDEVAYTGAAGAARVVEDAAALANAPVVAGETAAERLVQHTYAADLALAAPARTGAPSRDLAHGLGQWFGDVSRRFERARQYLRQHDARSVQTDLISAARRYPVQALAGTLLAGLVVGRILRRK